MEACPGMYLGCGCPVARLGELRLTIFIKAVGEVELQCETRFLRL